MPSVNFFALSGINECRHENQSFESHIRLAERERKCCIDRQFHVFVVVNAMVSITYVNCLNIVNKYLLRQAMSEPASALYPNLPFRRRRSSSQGHTRSRSRLYRALIRCKDAIHIDPDQPPPRPTEKAHTGNMPSPPRGPHTSAFGSSHLI